jgi:hypothetical protein
LQAQGVIDSADASAGEIMGPKLLFVLGIVLAHGALGAAWIQQDAPQARSPIATCVNAPAPLPHFEPPREILAMRAVPISLEDYLQP